jgi:hypothetical protein
LQRLLAAAIACMEAALSRLDRTATQLRREGARARGAARVAATATPGWDADAVAACRYYERRRALALALAAALAGVAARLVLGAPTTWSPRAVADALFGDSSEAPVFPGLWIFNACGLSRFLLGAGPQRHISACARARVLRASSVRCTALATSAPALAVVMDVMDVMDVVVVVAVVDVVVACAPQLSSAVAPALVLVLANEVARPAAGSAHRRVGI